ncbi:MAG: response regulator [Spirochaetales bacterium]|nr:response regulator [Spirochaetales bacterium]
MEQKLKFSIFLIAGISLSVIIINLIPFLIQPSKPKGAGLISSKMFFLETEKRKSSFDLKSIDESYQKFQMDRLISNSRFAYLWLEISNRGEEDREIVFTNRTRNYYTELLLPEASGAVTLSRHGDIVPVFKWSFRHYKPGFPLIIPAGSTGWYVVEYHGPRGLTIDPEILSSSEWVNRLAIERSLSGFLCGAFVFLLLIITLNGFLLNRKYFYSTIFFIASVFFFFLKQSGILLLIIDPWIYPEWLYPLSIALNLLSVLFLSRIILSDYLSLQKVVILKSIEGITILLTAAALFYEPYIIADILNLLSLAALPVIINGVYLAVRKRDEGVLFIVLSFIPCIFMLALDIISANMDVRLTLSSDYLQAFGMIASLLFLSITLQYVRGQKQQMMYIETSKELRQACISRAEHVTSVTELRSSVLHQVGYQLRQPLDSILALSSILANEYADPRIAAVSKMLSSEAGELKRKIENEVGNLGSSDVSLVQAEAFDDHENMFSYIPAPRPWINSRICIYDTDPRHDARTALILRSRGYEVDVSSDHYQILSLVSGGKIDVLIIDPTTAGESAFSLCALIRGDHNLFDIPILMIINYQADYLLKKGYAAGVNDFLTRPFDAVELAARIESLVRLKQVARYNHDLARSEKEKNIFLYFLTHNINTPLTLLLNRVNELKDIDDLGELYEITDDLLASSREISDMVQNMLISFRLSDGRQTVRLNEIEMKPIIYAVERDLQKKAEDKQQKLIIDLPREIPAVMGDFTAVRGILYNLLDNGLKFTPPGGEVRLAVTAADAVVLEVSDTGPGIHESEQGRLFKRFERLSTQPTAGESSTGLGLYVAFELARMNGGELEYHPGEDGACFRLTLPRFYKETATDE